MKTVDDVEATAVNGPVVQMSGLTFGTLHRSTRACTALEVLIAAAQRDEGCAELVVELLERSASVVRAVGEAGSDVAVGDVGAGSESGWVRVGSERDRVVRAAVETTVTVSPTGSPSDDGTINGW